MKDANGDLEFPIWLIGDSSPEAWVDKQDTPLHTRHMSQGWSLDNLSTLRNLPKPRIHHHLTSTLVC